MNELIQMLQQKTGLSADVSQKVVQTVLEYVEAKLPGPMSAGLKSLLGDTGTQTTAAAAGAEGGGLLDKAKSMMDSVLGSKDA